METFNYKIKRRAVRKIIKSMNIPPIFLQKVNQIMPFVRSVSKDRRSSSVPPMDSREIQYVALVALNNVINCSGRVIGYYPTYYRQFQSWKV